MSAIGWSLAGASARAQSAGAPQLKAAFLFNFARFTDWPALDPGAPLVLCVLGDEQVFSELSSVVRGQAVNGRHINVSKLSAGATIRTCQVLFVSAPEVTTNTQLLDTARTLPVLTVSDSARFAESSGIVELFVDAGRMRFAVNLDAAQRTKLRLSSNLLAIAKIVRDKAKKDGA
jgi:hypothetical protein